MTHLLMFEEFSSVKVRVPFVSFPLDRSLLHFPPHFPFFTFDPAVESGTVSHPRLLSGSVDTAKLVSHRGPLASQRGREEDS